MSGKTYKFIGEGDGVPGLPHEVSEQEAADLGVSELLAEAVKNGAYAEKDFVNRGKRPVTASGKTPPAAQETEKGA